MFALTFRRSLILGLLAASTTFTFAQTKALIPVKYQVASIPGGIDAPVYLAKMRGLYEKEGLDVEIVPGRTSQDAVNSIIAGSAKIGSSLGVNVIMSADKGQKVTAIGARYGKNVFGVLVGGDTGINSIKDMKNRKVIVPGASYETLLKMVLKKNGIDPAANQYILIPNPSAMITAYSGKQSDGALTVVPWAQAVVEGKRDSKGLLFADLGIPEPGYVYIASPETVKNDPEMLKKFMRATYEASRILHGDPKLVAEATMKFVPGADATVSIGQFEQMKPFECSLAEKGKPFGPQSLSDWKETVQIYKDMGITTSTIDPASLFSNVVFEGNSGVSREKCPG